jgi:hypothetical protein
MVPVENGELLQVLRYVLGTGECLLNLCNILNHCRWNAVVLIKLIWMAVQVWTWPVLQSTSWLFCWWGIFASNLSMSRFLDLAIIKKNCNYCTESTVDFLFVSVQLKERWAESCHHAHVSIRWCGRWWNLFSIGADFFYHLSLNARTLEQLNIFPFASMIGLEVYQSRSQILVSETKVSHGCSFCWLHF